MVTFGCISFVKVGCISRKVVASLVVIGVGIDGSGVALGRVVDYLAVFSRYQMVNTCRLVKPVLLGGNS